MQTVGQLNHKKFSTIIKISQEVENFLRRNNIDPNLGSRFPSPEYFYENILFQKPENKNHKNFELIYHEIFNESKSSKNLEDIQKKLKLKKEDIALDGSVHILEIEPKTSIRWIVRKLDSH